MTIRAWRSHGARSNNHGTSADRESPRKDRIMGPLARLHHRCVGCETQGRPGRSGRPNLRYERWGNRRRGTRRRGAVTAIEWRTVRREPQAVVRSTLPEARAEVSALVRTRLPGAVRSEVRARSAGAPARVQRAVRGEAGTRRRTGCTGPSRRRCPQPAQPVRASAAQAATSAARSAGARRTRRWCQRCRRTLRAAGQAERAATEGSGGARDTRPKGRDRAAGSTG